MLAEHYFALKALHVGAVVVSVTLFALRAALKEAGSSAPDRLAWRVVPQVVDTVLLGSAIALTLVLHQYPFTDAWLTAKVTALVAYVVLGTIALRRGRTRLQRRIALAGALVCVAYIVGTALHHDPNPLRW